MKIAVFGASGYTGRLVVAELRRRGLGAVTVGRDAGRLRAAAAEAGLADRNVRVAEAGDAAALAAAFRDCDAVVNCAGPFTRWGEPVVAAALAAGVPYVDTAGEQPYLKRVFDAFGAAAERAGVPVVPAVTDDGVPSDLLAHLTAARVGEAEEVTIALELTGGGLTRGSIRSLGGIAGELRDGGLGYVDGAWTPRAAARRKEFVMAQGSGPVPVRRTALPAVVTAPRHVRTRHLETVTTEEVYGLLASLPPEPADGVPEGPDPRVRAEAGWSFAVEATGRDGRRARGEVRGRDTYRTTALVAVEGAYRLVTRGAPAGVLAPAQAFDAVSFLDFLAGHGAVWSVADLPGGV
ncbi:saccharopine dehydrogenase NADP-binding domain-containing protein [Streptomyces sp. B1866]|uniref:saccharopine dehydrogenase NADP-binding domain-containing protein n=1 Tax=Streptomyces sp. B1866 TaxID=3075431 RepID=UPI00288DA1BE|nr:saccharopine dehydrogenase NADP-binding domain-containing protein [Streptomyces sp. B1866]MDT3400490.1 saccharopine dehydrogenase NADP-binding domain-containing protein [Streptomyces sp. B1866]